MPLPADPFDVKQTLFSGLTLIVLKAPQVSGFTAATDTVSKVAHGFANGQGLSYVSGTGFSGLVASTVYYVVGATSDTFQLAATPGGSAITLGTSSDGVFAPVEVFGSKLLNSSIEQEIKPLERPDSAGVLRNVRSVLTKQNESFTFEIDEVKRLLPVFGGALAGRIKGTVVLYCPDRDDASGKVALKSEEFPCTVTREGDLSIGNSEFSKATFRIESNKNGPVAWTADASV